MARDCVLSAVKVRKQACACGCVAVACSLWPPHGADGKGMVVSQHQLWWHVSLLAVGCEGLQASLRLHAMMPSHCQTDGRTVLIAKGGLQGSISSDGT